MAEPTTDHLTAFAAVLIYGPSYTPAHCDEVRKAFAGVPGLRDRWAQCHLGVQAAIDELRGRTNTPTQTRTSEVELLRTALRALRNPDPSWAMPDVRSIATRALNGESLGRYERFRGAGRTGPPTVPLTHKGD